MASKQWPEKECRLKIFFGGQRDERGLHSQVLTKGRLDIGQWLKIRAHVGCQQSTGLVVSPTAVWEFFSGNHLSVAIQTFIRKVSQVQELEFQMSGPTIPKGSNLLVRVFTWDIRDSGSSPYYAWFDPMFPRSQRSVLTTWLFFNAFLSPFKRSQFQPEAEQKSFLMSQKLS